MRHVEGQHKLQKEISTKTLSPVINGKFNFGVVKAYKQLGEI